MTIVPRSRSNSILVVAGLLLPFLHPVAGAQQISIPRIEAMPNRPSPYLMRDWRNVALGYDSLAFNLNATGEYLPLVWLTSITVNYPPGPTFGLQSYVGSPSAQWGEGINCIPAVIGAALCGADKSNQNGYDWVRMCKEWFNRRPAEDVYLNSPDMSSGSDWWYDVMPNVFFYQLHSLYPPDSDFTQQFPVVADRWLAALRAMGASTTPWSLANVNHTAFALSTMTPTELAWKEPEAAGAIAWILYNAYVTTGDDQYRIGAELAMESLLVYLQNPAYELQLPYSAYIAARMNAELGTTYDIGKIVNWCFSLSSERPWGAIVGNWGGYDCSGLIGEVNGSNDYAFAMNTFEQVGALVPMVRYDPRFARAIGKWVLNAANAARLFYTNYLPDANQDSAGWAHRYDPNSYIAHEAMRQTDPANASISPFATGDAIGGGWAATNYGLYGSSHVGIFGGIIDTTNVPMILRLDVLKTDYFHDRAYSTYLYFNPDSVSHDVTLNVGPGSHDVYDAVSKSFVVAGVTGSTAVPVAANSAVLAVITPSGGSVTYDLDHMLVNGIVVDYFSGHPVANYPPRIKSLAPDTSVVVRRSSIHIYCAAADRDGDTLSFGWYGSGGAITGSAATVTWTAPDTVGVYSILCLVNDGHGTQTADTIALQVVSALNHAPTIQGMKAVPRKVDLRGTSMISCFAADPDLDSLTYSWTSTSGSFSGSGPTVTWVAPGSPTDAVVRCTVSDGKGGSASDSVTLEVRDFSVAQSGSLVACFPFSGNANDASGFAHNGTVNGATLVDNRFGQPNSAYSFNGVNSYIDVPNDSTLNFQNAITLNFWMKVGAFYPTREEYPLSHGNWMNRWKVSIGNQRLRWTVKTTAGTKDLDTESLLVLDSTYNVTTLYNGSDDEIYLNGQLDAFSSWSGPIATTTIDLTIGRTLPSEATYSFNGVLDDIRIYDYGLSVAQIESLYTITTGVHEMSAATLPTEYSLEPNYPNPFNPETVVSFQLPVASTVRLLVYDVLGREVAMLVHDTEPAGVHSVRFNASGLASGVYLCRMEAGGRVFMRKMIHVR